MSFRKTLSFLLFTLIFISAQQRFSTQMPDPYPTYRMPYNGYCNVGYAISNPVVSSGDYEITAIQVGYGANGNTDTWAWFSAHSWQTSSAWYAPTWGVNPGEQIFWGIKVWYKYKGGTEQTKMSSISSGYNPWIAISGCPFPEAKAYVNEDPIVVATGGSAYGNYRVSVLDANDNHITNYTMQANSNGTVMGTLTGLPYNTNMKVKIESTYPYSSSLVDYRSGNIFRKLLASVTTANPTGSVYQGNEQKIILNGSINPSLSVQEYGFEINGTKYSAGSGQVTSWSYDFWGTVSNMYYIKAYFKYDNQYHYGNQVSFFVASEGGGFQ